VIARLRPHMPAALAALVGMAVMAWLGLIGFAWTDYDIEASGAFKALADGHLGRFLELCPSYGGSMVLRAPFALVPDLWGGGELAIFRAVSLPCMAVAAALAVWLVARLREQGAPLLARGSALGVIVAGPVTYEALEYGHPEELVVATLCVAAVLAARARRPWWAAIALGLAIAAKPWALLAIGPVLVALHAHRLRSLLIAGLVAAAVLSPLAIGAGGAYTSATAGATQTGAIFQPWQAWWWLGRADKPVRGLDGQLKPGYRSAPRWINRISHPLIIVLSAPLTLLWARRRRRRGDRDHVDDELLLLAFILQVRCLLDPWNHIYYVLGALFALVIWETRSERRPPFLGLTISAAAWGWFESLPGVISPDLLAATYMAWALPLTAYMALRLYAPERLASLPRMAQLAPAAVSYTRPVLVNALPSGRPPVDQ
jgi:hypothetical protein